MSERIPRTLLLFSSLCIFYVTVTQAVKEKTQQQPKFLCFAVGHILSQLDFVQTLEPNAEYKFQFDDDEIFNVDIEHKETRWRLPQFGQLASFVAAGALQDINILKVNLGKFEKMSNYTKAKSVFQGDIHVFAEKPLVLGEPNSLICLANHFFPPVIKMRWLRNNQPVTDGVSETDYYTNEDIFFSKFLYLVTIPSEGDVYACSVEHDGLSINPTNKLWIPEVPNLVSETSENIVCGLGLAYGIAGIVVGIALIFKGKKNTNQTRNR
ncbi:H-2 class II histocompatibility antigen, A-Q alpha chain-like [Dendropsophus ebraccatus]|uniref:H-2 class II histocompatibility antigen, A-Q alpha chain-like n=1 Tax=Dendropsophus ebraccatus TaxID=150705 RepID=UPI003831B6F8